MADSSTDLNTELWSRYGPVESGTSVHAYFCSSILLPGTAESIGVDLYCKYRAVL